MNEEIAETTTDTPEETAEAASQELIMCYISKKMVPMSETVEVSYGPNKKFRVLPQYIRY